MLNLKEWLDHSEKEDYGFWPEDELLDYIHSNNADIQNPVDPGDIPVDPDDFYNSGGLFSFTYSNRLVRKGNNKEYEPEGLEIAPPGVAHRHMVNVNTVKYDDHSGIASGRYGMKDECPILCFWGSFGQLEKQATYAMYDKGLISPQTYLFDTSGNLGLAIDALKPKMPAKKKAELETKVQIGSKTYYLYDLPRLLHSLPSASPEWNAIAAFICSNTEQYPVLKNFLYKAKCQTSASDIMRSPERERRSAYWATSESFNPRLS